MIDIDAALDEIRRSFEGYNGLPDMKDCDGCGAVQPGRVIPPKCSDCGVAATIRPHRMERTDDGKWRVGVKADVQEHGLRQFPIDGKQGETEWVCRDCQIKRAEAINKAAADKQAAEAKARMKATANETAEG